MKVAQIVEEAIRPLFDDLEVKLIEVEYAKKNNGMHLTVYLDKETGITIDDCKQVADLVNPILDKLNPTDDDSYYFDVSSYGIDKPLKYDWQFNKYLDKMVTTKLYSKFEDLKEFNSILKEFDDEFMTFEIDDRIVKIERKQIATVLPFIKF